jgi:hypothetical protein
MDKNDSVCPINIGPKETNKRLIVGVALLLATIFLAYKLVDSHADRIFRLTVFLPLFFSLLCLLQAKKKTCVVLALQEKQNLDKGEETVKDGALRQSLWSNSLKIIIGSLILSNIFTALFFLLF